MSTGITHITRSATQEHILCTLLYFDIFNYPLKPEEIVRFLGMYLINEVVVRAELKQLQKERLIFQFEEFFTVRNSETIIARRITGNAEAEKYLKIAKKKARLIARFPFVRAVMASGSLSKGYMDKDCDLDFFIITAPGGLWIARTLLVLYKRLFLFNSHKYFCINYFVDTQHLEIEEKNLFTATELATLIPLYGIEYYHNLHRANTWLKKKFPNYQQPVHQAPLYKNNGIKKSLEQVLLFLFGTRLNTFFMTISLERWNRMYQKRYDQADFQVAFKTKEYASKNHPKNYQRKVRELYKEKLQNFTVTLDMKW